MKRECRCSLVARDSSLDRVTACFASLCAAGHPCAGVDGDVSAALFDRCSVLRLPTRRGTSLSASPSVGHWREVRWRGDGHSTCALRCVVVVWFPLCEVRVGWCRCGRAGGVGRAAALSERACGRHDHSGPEGWRRSTETNKQRRRKDNTHAHNKRKQTTTAQRADPRRDSSHVARFKKTSVSDLSCRPKSNSNDERG